MNANLIWVRNCHELTNQVWYNIFMKTIKYLIGDKRLLVKQRTELMEMWIFLLVENEKEDYKISNIQRTRTRLRGTIQLHHLCWPRNRLPTCKNLQNIFERIWGSFHCPCWIIFTWMEHTFFPNSL